MNNELIGLALAAGAKKAAVIRAQDIVLSPSFRKICAANGCGRYGKCWMCPPEIGEIEDLMETVRAFHFGLLYQTICEIEDGFDIEGMSRASHVHAQISQAVEGGVGQLLAAHLHLSCGGCNLCERCAKLDDQP